MFIVYFNILYISNFIFLKYKILSKMFRIYQLLNNVNRMEGKMNIFFFIVEVGLEWWFGEFIGCKFQMWVVDFYIIIVVNLQDKMLYFSLFFV